MYIMYTVNSSNAAKLHSQNLLEKKKHNYTLFIIVNLFYAILKSLQ